MSLSCPSTLDQSELEPLLTTSAEVDVVDVTRTPGDVIEARDRDVTSAEKARRPAQDALEPAGGTGARQRVAVDAANTPTTPHLG